MTLRVICALLVLACLVTFVLLCPVFLDRTTLSLIDRLASMRDQPFETQQASFEAYYKQYQSDRKWMNLIVYKARFDEIDVINDNMIAYFDGKLQYDDYEADMERLKSLIRELYEKTNADISNIA